MKERRYHISKKLLLCLFCMVLCIIPFQLSAQYDDTSLLYPDPGMDTAIPANSLNKAGKVFDEAIFRSVPDSTVARMKNEKAFSYANDPSYWVKEKKIYRKGFWDYVFGFFESGIVKVIFYALLAGLMLFVLYRIIVVNELLIFYSAKKQKKISEEAGMTDLDPLMIDEKINEAINQKNYNIAVRFLYLKILYSLNDKKWIQFHREATNNQYLTQMSQHRKVKEFRFLTQVYEYMWYGRFEISEQQFLSVHDHFKSFQAAI